jgi:hypothetical protein
MIVVEPAAVVGRPCSELADTLDALELLLLLEAAAAVEVG